MTYLALLVLFSLAYALLAPNIFQQDWDSLMYGHWAEVNGIRSIWGNHPLGHIVLNSVYIILADLGYHGKALLVFVVCNSIFGGAAVASFFSLARLMGSSYLSCLGCAIVFGASYGLWHYSGSADIYSLSVLLLVLAWMSLIYQVLVRKDRCLYVSGALAGLSVLSHQLSAVLILVAIIVILLQKDARWDRIATFYAVAFLVILVGLVVFGHIATCSFSISAIYSWTRGYLGDPIYGDNLEIESIPLAWKAALATGLAPTYGRARFIRIAVYAFLAGSVLLGMTQIKHLDHGTKTILLSALAQCLANSLLIVWFEPGYPKFWLLTLVPGMIVLACCIHALEQRFALGSAHLSHYTAYSPTIVVMAGLVVLAFNLKYAILNEHRPDSRSQQALDVWLEHSDPGDMLITAGDLVPQLWFWSNRPNTVHLYHYIEVNESPDDRFAYLRRRIDDFLCDGDRVIFAPAAVDNFADVFLSWLDVPRKDLRTFFDSYQRERYFVYRNMINGKETQVYRLANPNACVD